MSPPTSKVLLICLLLCAVNVVTGLQCLECEEVYNPVDCSLVGTCGRDEVCFTRRFINFRGQTAYRMGCEEQYICDLFNQTPSHVIVGRDVNEAICRQCCEENYCNSMLCRETLTNRPPVQTPPTNQPTPASTTVPSTGLSENVQTTTRPLMRDCGDYLGKATSGVHEINPDGLSPFDVYCSMSASSGWTVIQRRFNGSVNFNQTWESYKNGFGSLDGEFWLGNEYIHRLTSVPGKHYTLWFDLTAENGAFFTAYYNNFTVGPESDAYRVNFTTYHGNAGDRFRYNQGMKFSTPDHNDHPSINGNCPLGYQAGWWYDNFCSKVLLNGVYGSGIWWNDDIQLKTTVMSIKSVY